MTYYFHDDNIYGLNLRFFCIDFINYLCKYNPAMEAENIYDKIREIFGEVPGSFSILEEQVDIDLQMEYFEVSKLVKKDLDEDLTMNEKEEIFNFERDLTERKALFARLASTEKIEAYRIIEKYLKEGQAQLRNWALLALQESRMLLETNLLDENQVFISTGLGGKGSMLRYFIVIILKEDTDFTDWQKKTVKNELEIILKRNKAEIEKIEFKDAFATLLAVIPLNIPLKEIFREAIEECNKYGNFLRANFIITNVRTLEQQEIKEFLEKQKASDQ